MTDKKIKIIYFLNVLLTVVALILECMPNSVIKAVEPLSGPDDYKISYYSYFADPSVWDVTLFFAFIIAILTIICIIFNIVILLKRNKAIYVTSVVFSSITLVLSACLATNRFATIFNLLIFAIFLIQTTIEIVVILSKDNQGLDRRIELVNVTSVFVLAIALFF